MLPIPARWTTALPANRVTGRTVLTQAPLTTQEAIVGGITALITDFSHLSRIAATNSKSEVTVLARAIAVTGAVPTPLDILLTLGLAPVSHKAGLTVTGPGVVTTAVTRAVTPLGTVEAECTGRTQVAGWPREARQAAAGPVHGVAL